jgi:hypothetical protein
VESEKLRPPLLDMVRGEDHRLARWPLHLSRYRELFVITSCSCAVSMYWWKLLTMPFLSFHTWHAWASSVLPVGL